MDSKFGDGSSLPYFNPYKTCGNGGLSRAFKRINLNIMVIKTTRILRFINQLFYLFKLYGYKDKY